MAPVSVSPTNAGVADVAIFCTVEVVTAAYSLPLPDTDMPVSPADHAEPNRRRGTSGGWGPWARPLPARAVPTRRARVFEDSLLPEKSLAARACQKPTDRQVRCD